MTEPGSGPFHFHWGALCWILDPGRWRTGFQWSSGTWRSGSMAETHERLRLREARTKGVAWRKWGPYLSERQWGTVREDYSDSGDAWNYFTHDQSRSRAYRWGEDGIGGIS